MRLNREDLLKIMVFSTLWGLSEAGIGGILYRHNIPYASSFLTIIAFGILSTAKVYLPQKATSSIIGAIAMLYKFLNTPFFGCHLLAIFLLGVSFDLIFNVLNIKNKALCGIMATYLGYLLFGLTITYVFRYRYWTIGGFPKIVHYVGTDGTIASLANAIMVPLFFIFANNAKASKINFYLSKSKLIINGMSFAIFVIWVLSIVTYINL